MLFDLTGRGRRRTVRVVYSGLALLFLLGFVGFGVGSIGGGGGGIFEAVFGGKENTSGPNYEGQVKAAKKLTVQQPRNAAAWSALIHATLLQAGTGENFSSSEVAFNSSARPLLQQVQEAWQHYLALTPHHPSTSLAAAVLPIYTDPGGISNPTGAMQALKIEITGRAPSATLYYDLAVLAYQANDKKEGDRAAKKALALAPAGDRKTLQSYLANARAGKPGTTPTPTAGGTSTAASGAQTVTIPASKLGKGATKAQTVTIPASALKGVSTTTAPASTTAPAGTPAPGKKK